MKKLQKTAKTLERIFRFFQRLTVAGCVLGSIVIFFMWYLWLGDHSIGNLLHTTLQFGGIQFSVASSVPRMENSFFWYLLFGTIIGGAQLPVMYMGFGAIRGILDLMIQGTPFHEHIVYYLKKLGWLTIANGILTIAGSFVLQGNLLHQYDLSALFLSDQITNVTTGYSADLSFLIYAMVLFLLAQVFQYGLELQTLSDETL